MPIVEVSNTRTVVYSTYAVGLSSAIIKANEYILQRLGAGQEIGECTYSNQEWWGHPSHVFIFTRKD